MLKLATELKKLLPPLDLMMWEGVFRGLDEDEEAGFLEDPNLPWANRSLDVRQFFIRSVQQRSFSFF